MKLCLHDWTVWTSSADINKSRLIAIIAILASICGVFIPIVTNPPLIIGIFSISAGILSLASGAFVVGMASEGISAYCYEDKTCLKCGKNVFNNTKFEARLAKEKQVAAKRAEKINEIRKYASRDLMLFKKAHGINEN